MTLTVDNRNLADMTAFLEDRVEAMKKRITELERDIRIKDELIDELMVERELEGCRTSL